MRGEADERTKRCKESEKKRSHSKQRCGAKESEHSENITKQNNANAYLALGMHNIFGRKRKQQFYINIWALNEAKQTNK